MKAKYFKRLRAKLQYFEVERTHGLFGDFKWKFKGETVLAYNHNNACERYNKRHHKKRSVGDEATEGWARYKVKLKDKIDHARHFKYFR